MVEELRVVDISSCVLLCGFARERGFYTDAAIGAVKILS